MCLSGERYKGMLYESGGKIMKLKKMNVLPGIYIPLENCDKCKRRCENFGKMKGVYNDRKKIAEYVNQMQIMDVYLYDTPFEMYEKLGFTLTTPNLNGYNYNMDSSMIIIDIMDDKKQLCICVIDSPSEELMLEELKNNKINFFFNISKAQQNYGKKK